MAVNIENIPNNIKNNPEKLGAVLMADKCLTLSDRVKELEGVIDDITNESNFHPIKDWAICGIYHNSSSGSEGRKTRMETFYKFISLIESAKKLIKGKA